MVYMRIILNFAILLFCLLATKNALAQDERFFRKLFSGEFVNEKKVQDEKHYSYAIHSSEFLIDLNDDGLKDSLVVVKRDSEDWLDVFNSSKDKVFSYKFEPKGANSALYRVLKKKLDEKTNVLVMFYYEGETNYVNYESSARVYLMTVDNKDLKTISVFKGPSIFEEQKTYKSHYHLRNYEVEVVDIDKNSKRELIVKNREMSQVFLYSGNGIWKTF